jgi:hypothetical protein
MLDFRPYIPEQVLAAPADRVVLLVRVGRREYKATKGFKALPEFRDSKVIKDVRAL